MARPDTLQTAVTESDIQPRLCKSILSRYTSALSSTVLPKPSYPPVSSIPRTSPERLAAADPDAPASSAPETVLYLAYGSNLAASTFLGQRGIRPISQLNVSAPSFDLIFDLPGFPYNEPCFSNVAPRKIPDKPPKLPPHKPLPIPDPTLPPPYAEAAGYGHGDLDVEQGSTALPALPPRGPTWSKGLYGVVYEVTPEDYRHIISTEGGGSGYQDVLTPCLPLPPAIAVPEKPPIPEIPRPFLAHTLYFPRLPFVDDGDDGGDGDDDNKSAWKKWMLKLARMPRRPDPTYAQPSLRYLNLLRDGAKEHALPEDYQEYLMKLQPYTMTTLGQKIARILVLLLWLPLFLCIVGLTQIVQDDQGRVPQWLATVMSALMNLMWMAYDGIFKKLFGDGERTIEPDEERYTRRRSGWGSEKNALLSDW